MNLEFKCKTKKSKEWIDFEKSTLTGDLVISMSLPKDLQPVIILTPEQARLLSEELKKAF